MQERLAALARRLRGLERDALARLPGEPWLHAKRLLADHARDDAATAAALEALAGEAPGDAGPEPIADRRASALALAAEARELLGRATDERVLAALVELELRQRRHADETAHRVPAAGEGDAAGEHPDDPPGPIDEAIAAAVRAARDGDTEAAAAHMLRAAELDAERTRAGEFYGLPR